MARGQKLKVQFKREKTSLGWVYRIYIGGMYMATASSREAARESIERVLAMYERTGGLSHRSNKRGVNYPLSAAATKRSP